MQAELERAQQQVESLKHKITELEKGLASSSTITESNNCQWIIDRREIHIPELEQKKILGQGGWATSDSSHIPQNSIGSKMLFYLDNFYSSYY